MTFKAQCEPFKQKTDKINFTVDKATMNRY